MTKTTRETCVASNLKNQVVVLLHENKEAQKVFFDSEAGRFDQGIPKYYEDEMTDIYNSMKESGIRWDYVYNEGGEGQGEDYWSVYKFSNKEGEEVFVKFYGWYYSYDGSNYDDFKVVQPKEKTVVVYE